MHDIVSCDSLIEVLALEVGAGGGRGDSPLLRQQVPGTKGVATIGVTTGNLDGELLGVVRVRGRGWGERERERESDELLRSHIKGCSMSNTLVFLVLTSFCKEGRERERREGERERKI